MKHRGTLFAAIVLALLTGISPLAAAEPVIQRGIDVFTTTDNGKTYYDFAKNPIPAGFFCDSSAPFTGRVAFKGLPLATAAPGQLRGADTVIERLDDAVFNSKGTAATRIRFRALSMVSSAPVQTACGAFHAYVSLADKQRVTTMNIHLSHPNGGTFAAPLAVDVRLTFIPLNGASARKLELTGSFTFPAAAIPWSFKAGPGPRQIGSAVFDTNGDQAPDTALAGTSNFWPGWSPGGQTAAKVPYGCYECEPPICAHEYQGKVHCSGGVYACGAEVCP